METDLSHRLTRFFALGPQSFTLADLVRSLGCDLQTAQTILHHAHMQEYVVRRSDDCWQVRVLDSQIARYMLEQDRKEGCNMDTEQSVRAYIRSSEFSSFSLVDFAACLGMHIDQARTLLDRFVQAGDISPDGPDAYTILAHEWW